MDSLRESLHPFRMSLMALIMFQESGGFPSPIPSMADYVVFGKQSRGETSKNTKSGKELADFTGSFLSTPDYVDFEKQSRGKNSMNIKATKVTMNTQTAKESQDLGNLVRGVEGSGVTFKIYKDSNVSKKLKDSCNFVSPGSSLCGNNKVFKKQKKSKVKNNSKMKKEPADFTSSFLSTPNYVAFEKQSRGENSMNIKAAKVTMNTKTAKEPQDLGNIVRGVEGSGVTFKIYKDSKVSKKLKVAEL